jgi:hypothetical protein
MTFEEYVAIPALNWSLLKHMAVSPKHFVHAQTHPREDTLAMRLGRATHTAVLEPDRFPLEYVVWTGGRRAGKDWERFVDDHATRTILSESEYQRCLDIRDAVRSHRVAVELLTGGEAEVTLQWTDPDTGLPCKARLDYLRPGTVVDLKTTSDISEWAFARTCAKYRYHGQGAFYTEGACRTRCMPHTFTFIAVESDPPHDVAVWELDQDSLEAGELLVAGLLARVKSCTESGIWEGAYPTPRPLRMPSWILPSEFEIQELGINFGGDK